jgi:hypothetical protein
VDINVYDGDGSWVSSTTSACANAGTFIGFESNAVEGIGSIIFDDPSGASVETLDDVCFGGTPTIPISSKTLIDTLMESHGISHPQAQTAIDALLTHTQSSHASEGTSGYLGLGHHRQRCRNFDDGGVYEAFMNPPAGAYPIWWRGSTEVAGYIQARAGGWMLRTWADWGPSGGAVNGLETTADNYRSWHDRYPQYRSGAIDVALAYQGPEPEFCDGAAEGETLHFIDVQLPPGAFIGSGLTFPPAQDLLCRVQDNVNAASANNDALNYDGQCSFPQAVNGMMGLSESSWGTLVFRVMVATGLDAFGAEALLSDMLAWYSTDESSAISGLGAYSDLQWSSGGWWSQVSREFRYLANDTEIPDGS